MIEKFIENIKRPMYWLPRILLIVLCFVHDKTKYHTARSIADLFYWPDGFCMDMVVIALFFGAALWCIWEDSRVFTDASISLSFRKM